MAKEPLSPKFGKVSRQHSFRLNPVKGSLASSRAIAIPECNSRAESENDLSVEVTRQPQTHRGLKDYESKKPQSLALTGRRGQKVK